MDGSKYCCPPRRWRARRQLSQGQRQEMAALSVPKSPSSRRHKPPDEADGRDGRMAPTMRPS